MKPVQFKSHVEIAFNKVFINDDPFGAPFQQEIRHRLLLYWFRYGLSDADPWLVPVTTALKLLGEDGFYLSLVGIEDTGESPSHWYVPLEEANIYRDSIFPLVNAIYSVNGHWGIICSDEDHALAGGSELFIKTIYDAIPDWDHRINRFIETWKKYYLQNKKIRIDWLPTQLTHIFGLATSQSILHAHNLDWLWENTSKIEQE